MSLYKFLPANYADALINLGSIRIGTLYGFRDAEKLDAERGDRLEGARQYYGPRCIDSSKNDDAAAYLRRTTDIEGSVFTNQIGPAFINEIVAKDCYIYCTTSRFDEQNCQKMGGACVEIVDPRRFFNLVDSELQKRRLIIGTHEIAECVYQAKVEDFREDKTAKAPVWKCKPKAYAHQNEVRTMWIPTKETDLQGTLKSTFYKYVTLEAEALEMKALIGESCFRRIR